MERYVIQADLFMPHLIIASCDGGWLILMGWQPSILSMDLQRGAFYFSELAIIFVCILKQMFGVYGAYQPCSIYFHDGPVQMHVAAETPRPGRGSMFTPPQSTNAPTLSFSFYSCYARDRYFSVKEESEGYQQVSMSIFLGKYCVSYLTWNSIRLKCWSPLQRNPVHGTSFQNMELLWQKGD